VADEARLPILVSVAQRRAVSVIEETAVELTVKYFLRYFFADVDLDSEVARYWIDAM
jgi:hypothetical protein